MRGVLFALLVLCGGHVSQGQTPVTVDESEPVRQAVQSYLDTTAQNSEAKNPVPSNVVHPQAKIFSTLGNDFFINGISRKPLKRKGELIKTRSTSQIVLVDVTGSMAVAKVETVYPHGSLTEAEYNSLPENDPLRISAGKPRKLSSYLSLLKLGGDWKIVSFLISADAEGDK
jgi:hypothetical protein